MMGQQLGHKHVALIVGMTAGLLALPPVSLADQLFHTERLEFFLTPEGASAGHPELRSGQVIDIHPNGPKYGALERYMVNGAKPNHEYNVVLRIFDGDCAGDPTPGFDPLPTATLATRKNGNAHAAFSFPAGSALPEPLFLGVYWTLVDEDTVVAYETDCISVGLDSL